MANMTHTFHKFGIAFSYPETWSLDEEELAAGAAVTVTSPAGAFWTVAIHPISVDPDQASTAVLDALRQEFEDAEYTDVVEPLADHAAVGYEVHFTCLDLTNTARVRSPQIAHTTYTIFCQAEDREFERIGRVFEAMTTSLINGLLP